MIFLLNYERVRVEVAELTRFRIAQVLHISPSEVVIEAQRDEETGKLVNAWSIRALPEGLTPERAREVAIEVGRHLNKTYLLPRLQDAQRVAVDVRREHAQEA